jgi:hypothetical protein
MWWLLILVIWLGPVGFIFLDYHKAHNIHKALVFIALFFASLFLIYFLLNTFRLQMIYFVPLFSLIPFILLFVFRKRKGS